MYNDNTSFDFKESKSEKILTEEISETKELVINSGIQILKKTTKQLIKVIKITIQ